MFGLLPSTRQVIVVFKRCVDLLHKVFGDGFGSQHFLQQLVPMPDVEAEFIGEQETAVKMFAMLGFSNLLRFEDYVKDMQAISHDYILMGLNLKVDEEYAGVGG